MENIIDPENNHIKQREFVDSQIDNHPKRYFKFIGADNEEHTVDIKGMPFHKVNFMKEKGAEEVDIEEFHRIRNKYFQPLWGEKKRLTRAINTLAKRHKAYSLDNHKSFLIELMGTYRTDYEVYKLLQKEKGVTFQMHAISAWRKLHKKEIMERRELYKLDNAKTELRASTEEGRLEVLNKMLGKWEWRNEERMSEGSSNMLLRILDQARKEVKGDLITVNGQIDIKATLHADEALMSTLRKIPINSLIVGLTAAQNNINPDSIISALANSQYSKLNGFNGEVKGNEEIRLPSEIIKSYDWANLESKVKAVNQDNSKPIREVMHFESAFDDEVAEEKKRKLLAAAIGFQKRFSDENKNEL